MLRLLNNYTPEQLKKRKAISNIFITFVMKCSELIRLLTRNGWTIVRQSGSHMLLVHPDKEGKIVCPNHGSREIGKGLEKKIKKDAGLN